MKINITKKQYKVLVKSLEMAGSVYGISGDMIDDKYKKDSDNIEALIDHVLGYARDFDMVDMVEEFEGKKYVTEDYKSKQMDDLLEFEDYAFFDSLVRKLARKEFFETYSSEKRAEKGKEKCMTIVWELEEKYWKWVNKGGFDDWKGVRID